MQHQCNSEAKFCFSRRSLVLLMARQQISLTKTTCGHQCCKYGVAVKEVRSEKKLDQASDEQTPKRQKSDQTNPKTPAKRKGNAMDGFLEKLSSKKSTLPDTPGAKRIKYPGTMHHSSEIDDDSTDDLLRSVPSSNLEMKFSYQPRKVSFKGLLKKLNDGNSTASSSSPPSPTKQGNMRTPSGIVDDFQHLRSGSRHSSSFGSGNKTSSISHYDVFGDGQFNDIDDEIQCDFSLLPDDILNDNRVTFLHKGTESLPIRNKANNERKSEKNSIYYEDDGCFQFDDDELKYELERNIENEWDIWSKSNTTKEIKAERFFQAGATNMGNKFDMTRHGPEFSNGPKSGTFVKINHRKNVGETRNQSAGEKTDALKLTTRGRSFTRSDNDIVLSRKPYLSSVNGSDQNDSKRPKQPIKGQFDKYTKGSWDADVVVVEWANENHSREQQSIAKGKKAASDEIGTGMFVRQPDYYDIEDVDISDSPFCNLTYDSNPVSRRDYEPEKKKHEATERQPFKVLSRNAQYQSMNGNMGNDQGLFSPVYKRDINCDTEVLTISSAESETGNGVQERKTGHFGLSINGNIDSDESTSKAAELERCRSLPGDWFVDESKCNEEENEFDFCEI
ncbi:uncharacterized protein LOC135692675 [Rhopilema esculentum]|uniref:uncharacterized protein LOC135692675 n=1 Tax=Rhopilema esculentum TaxID=499914 RepID=UPI0031D3BC40